MTLNLICILLSLFLITQFVSSFPAETLKQIDEPGQSNSAKEIDEAKKIDAAERTVDGQNTDVTLDKSHSVSGSIANANPNVRDNLPLLADVEYYNMGMQYLKDGTIMINRIMEDAAKLDNVKKTDKVDEHLNNFRAFIKEMKEDLADSNEEYDKIYIVNYLVQELSDLMDEFNSTYNNETIPDKMVVEELLLKNGWEELERTYYESYAKFVTKMKLAIEDYIGNLSDEGRQNDKDLIEWYEELKKQDNVIDQLEHFDEFFIILYGLH